MKAAASRKIGSGRVSYFQQPHVKGRQVFNVSDILEPGGVHRQAGGLQTPELVCELKEYVICMCLPIAKSKRCE